MRSLPDVVDSLAVSAPDQTWITFGEEHGQVLSWRKVSWLQLARAVDFMADWMESRLGPPAADEVVAYMGPNDVRYPIIMLAAIKTSYRILLPSPRNSTEAQRNLLHQTQCCKFLVAESTPIGNLGDKLLSLPVPTLDDLLAIPGMGPFRKGCTEIDEDEIALILHSSGSTGLPKPIYVRAGALATIDTLPAMPTPPGRRNMHDELYAPSATMVSMMPFFHVVGVNLLCASIYHQAPLALLPATRPPSAELMLNAINHLHPGSIVCAPSILEDISKSPGGLDALSTLKYAFYGGGPLARSCGDQITQVTHLQSGIGSTETGNIPIFLTEDPADWEYFEWNTDGGLVMEPATGQLFELVIKHRMDRYNQSTFYNFPAVCEWRTKDLFEAHPTKPSLWRYVGRKDDLIVFSNGEKVNPVSFEKNIEGHPWVQGALVVGMGRFQAGLLIEAGGDYQDRDETVIIDGIWPWIEKANAETPSHARVWRSMVHIASPVKPFSRTSKGSIMRQSTCRLYEAEIAALYDRQNAFDELELDGPADLASIKKMIQRALQFHNLDENVDFFSKGVDSLQVLQLSSTLSRVFTSRNGESACPPRLIYKNSTINRLAHAISDNLNPQPAQAKQGMSREEKISAMVYKYTKSLPILKAQPPPLTDKHTVILTGSTGFLGTYLLHYLLSNPIIHQIYCLNRSSNAPEKQNQSLLTQNLPIDNYSKTHFLTTDLTQPNFGLSLDTYATLQQQTTLFIHNAWPVNFNTDLEHFEPAIAGVRNIVDFTITAPSRPRILFTSSIASVGNWKTVRDDDPVPEVFDDDFTLPFEQGYGESKHVASTILARASQRSAVRATILRLGQLAGPLDGGGIWNKAEWIPSLISTSKSLGKIPRSLSAHNVIDWVPVDMAAQSILDLSLSQRTDSILDCFNISNPHITQWTEIVDSICDFYHARGEKIDLVNMDEWIHALTQIDMTPDTIRQFPAIKLIETFEGMFLSDQEEKVQMAADRGVGCSRSMASLQPLTGELMGKWLESWGF